MIGMTCCSARGAKDLFAGHPLERPIVSRVEKHSSKLTEFGICVGPALVLRGANLFDTLALD